jgi:hypothetical protein
LAKTVSLLLGAPTQTEVKLHEFWEMKVSTMKSKSLAILLKVTKPKSKEEMRAFLIERHGVLGRDNASADVTALDDRDTKALKAAQKAQDTAVGSITDPGGNPSPNDADAKN